MIDRERYHCDVLVFIDNTGLDLVDIDFVSGLVGVLQTLRPSLNVGRVCLQNMFCHLSSPRRSIDRQRALPSHNPWCEKNVRKAERVIGMEMRDESYFEIRWLQSSHAFVSSCCRAPNNPGPKIDKV